MVMDYMFVKNAFNKTQDPSIWDLKLGKGTWKVQEVAANHFARQARPQLGNKRRQAKLGRGSGETGEDTVPT